jgi:hypothetical protein
MPLSPVTGESSGLVPGKLASGAGLSIIPQWIARELALSPHGKIWARSYDGDYSGRQVYFADFIVDGHKLRAVQCLAIERETVLIGRNASIVSGSPWRARNCGFN